MEPRGLSAEREDGKEGQRDRATTPLAPDGSNAATACPVSLDLGPAAAPQEAGSVELPAYLFIFLVCEKIIWETLLPSGPRAV